MTIGYVKIKLIKLEYTANNLLLLAALKNNTFDNLIIIINIQFQVANVYLYFYKTNFLEIFLLFGWKYSCFLSLMSGKTQKQELYKAKAHIKTGLTSFSGCVQLPRK